MKEAFLSFLPLVYMALGVVAAMLLVGVVCWALGIEIRYKTDEEQDDGQGPRLN
jgi:hypothetical protein